MSIGTGVVLFVIGAILVYAINVDVEFVNLDMMGYILMVAGVIVFVVGLVLYTVRRRRRADELTTRDDTVM